MKPWMATCYALLFASVFGTGLAYFVRYGDMTRQLCGGAAMAFAAYCLLDLVIRNNK